MFIYADKSNVPIMMQRDSKHYRIISDHLGSVRMVLDVQTNAIMQQLDYDAWGRVIADSNPGYQPFGFAGGLYDPETGLTRFGARDYDGETGKWTAKDPILFDGGDTNLFAYVGGDPVGYIDLNGLQQKRPGKLISLMPLEGEGGGINVGGRSPFSRGGLENCAPSYFPKGGPPRDPRTANYLPDPNASGPHTTLGTRNGRNGEYLQGATFDGNGRFLGRTDVTNHDRGDHTNPHWHPAKGPNSVGNAQPIP